MPSSKRSTGQDDQQQGDPAAGTRTRKSGGSRSATRRAAASAPQPEGAGDTAALQGWLAPTATSSIDQVELGQIDSGWEPERTGVAPLEASVAAIQAVGVVEPVLLRPREGGRYEVVTGHRTVAAARVAGMERVPAVVKELDDAAALMALVFDGSASGQVTSSGAAELRQRLRAAGAAAEDVEDVMAAVPVAEVEAVPAGAGVAEELVGGEEELVAAAAVEEPVEVGEPIEALAASVAAEPEPVAAEPEPVAAEPEPVAAEPEPVPVGAGITGEREPVLAARSGSPEGAATASQGRWLPLPAGRPRLARLSSAFADAPRMLRILAGDRFTGTAELVGRDGRKDAVTFLDGRILATYVEQGERRVDAALRLPSPDRGPTVEITVRPHPRAVSVALALALRSPTRFTGLHAEFLHLPGLLDLLRRERTDAACVVSSPSGAGVILLDAGQPIAAYARRWGDEPGDEEAETTDVSAVLELLTNTGGEVDVHTGDVPEPLDLEEVIARSVPGD